MFLLVTLAFTMRTSCGASICLYNIASNHNYGKEWLLNASCFTSSCKAKADGERSVTMSYSSELLRVWKTNYMFCFIAQYCYFCRDTDV